MSPAVLLAEGAAKARPGNLPADLTSFIGRRRELAEIKRLLTTTRLLTLTGTGGAGKTRLALRAAAEMARNFSDGVWVVGLAPIDDPLLITQAVFSALGLQDVSSQWSTSALSDYLREKRLLLVVDNCEHLLDSAAVLVGTLLKACPELRILATSRQALGMPGEVRMRVPPLSLPELGGPLTAGQIASFDAVALLIERAAAVEPGFAISDENAPALLQLCRRLEGVPLALELAAVRLEGLTIEQLLAGLDHELSGPPATLRGGEPRQRTMEATLDWSFSLLNERQRRLWARLSVFAGGFTAEAAARVCSDVDPADEDFTDVLASLVESSILQRGRAASPRYSMLEPVRQYGRKKLRESGEEVQFQTRHRDWIVELSHADQFGPREAHAFRAVHLERDNLWSALEFCSRQPEEVAAGVDIVASLTNYWLSRGPLRDVRRYIDSLLPLTTQNRALHARCLIGCALFAAALDDAASAQVSGEQALALARELGDPMLTGWAAGSLLLAAFVSGRSDGVEAIYTLMVESSRSAGVVPMAAIAAHYMCSIRLAQNNVDEVIALGEEAVEVCRQAGDLFVRGTVINSLAEARRRRGELAEAEALAREGLSCKHELDDRRGLAALIETLAWVACDRRHDARAATLLGCAQSLRESIAIPLLAPFQGRHKDYEGTMRERLGDVAFSHAFDRGRAMSAGDAYDYAMERAAVKPAPAAPRIQSILSRRESEIARLLADGLTNREIASRLFISTRTVDTHVTNMLNKLGLNSRTQLARWVG